MMAEADLLQQQLLKAQNRDGGWGYQQGTSWTEPTALALLALRAHRNTGPPYDEGCLWLRRTQNTDGGWPPHPRVETSTSVTSLAVLASPSSGLNTSGVPAGVRWILEQENGEVPMLEGLAFRLLGVPPPKAPGGSPWYPGTAAWIAPTAMSVLALSQFVRTGPPDAIDAVRLRSSVRRAQQYILSRRCRDGGWNHGGSPLRSEDAESYPEMTGMALLALQDVSPAELEKPLLLAEAFLSCPQPAEALSWLQLALLRHGRKVPASNTPVACRTNRDICLRLIALAGADSSVFAESPAKRT